MPSPDPPARASLASRLALLAATAAFFALYTALGLARLRGFAPRSIDLAFYTQMLGSLAHGGAPMTLAGGAHPLTLHVMPVLWPLAPLVRLGCEPGAALVVAHAAALALALPAGFRLGGWLGVALVALCPATTAQANFDVHPDVWAFAPLLLAAAFEREGAHRPALVAWAAAFACRESLPLIGLVAAACQLRSAPRYARALAALSLAWGAVALGVMLATGGGPAASLAAHFGHAAATNSHDAARGAMHALTLRPWLAVLTWTLAAGALAPLAPRVALPALAVLVLDSLSRVPTTLWVVSHYAAPAFPFLLAATLAVVRAPPPWLAARGVTPRALRLLALVCVAGAYAARGDGPGAYRFVPDERPPDAIRTAYSRAVADLPPDACVAAAFQFGPAVAARARAFSDAPPRAGCDVVLLAPRPGESVAPFRARIEAWLAADPALGVADAPGAAVLRLGRGRDRRGVPLARGWLSAQSLPPRREPGARPGEACVVLTAPVEQAPAAGATLAVRAAGAGVALAFPGDGLWTVAMSAPGDFARARLCGPSDRLEGRALSWRWVAVAPDGTPVRGPGTWQPLPLP